MRKNLALDLPFLPGSSGVGLPWWRRMFLFFVVFLLEICEGEGAFSGILIRGGGSAKKR